MKIESGAGKVKRKPTNIRLSGIIIDADMKRLREKDYLKFLKVYSSKIYTLRHHNRNVEDEIVRRKYNQLKKKDRI